METWITMIVGLVGIAIVLAIPAWVWYMDIYGLVRILRQKRGKGSTDRPKTAP